MNTDLVKAALGGDSLLAAMAARDAEREARGEKLQGWRLVLECGHSFRSAEKASDSLTCCAASSCAGRKRIVDSAYLGMACKTCGQDIPVGDAHGPHYDLCLTCRGARIPARCPYRPGDRVQVHGYPGNPRMGIAPTTGWRGTVEGFLGATILTGIADDGRTWGVYWGSLVREGTPVPDRFMWCTCCPRPEVQGALFDLAEVL